MYLLIVQIERHTLMAQTFGVRWHALALETGWCLHACATVVTWLSYAVINSMLTVGTRITNWALTAVRLYIVHTGTAILTRFGCAVIDIDLAIHTTVSCLALARVGVQATDAYTIILARVCGAFVDVQLTECPTITLRTLTVKCSRFIDAFSSINTRRALCAKTVRKFALVTRVFKRTKAFECIHLP